MNVFSFTKEDLHKMTVYCYDVLLNHFDEKYKLIEPKLSQQYIAYPLFITINNPSRSNKLRGCIGTFTKDSTQTIFSHLKKYTIQTAFHDSRFANNHITKDELKDIELSISLLDSDVECKSLDDWNIGTDGIKINFIHNERKYGGTYLPEVAEEQSWDKITTIKNLIQKTGYSEEITNEFLQNIKIMKYASNKYTLSFKDFKKYKNKIINKLSLTIDFDRNNLLRYLTYSGAIYLLFI